MNPRYAELQDATNFSFLEGGSHPHELVARAEELGLPAIAITDRNSLAGIVRAHLAAGELRSSSPEGGSATQTRSSSPEGGGATKELDIKVIVGCRLTFLDGAPELLCYPQDRAAYGRLCRLLTVGKSDRVFKEIAAVAEELPLTRPLRVHPLPRGVRVTSVPVVKAFSFQQAPSAGEGLGERGTSAKEEEIPKGECHLTFEDFLTFSEGQLAALIPPDDVFERAENTAQFQAHLSRLAAHLKGRLYLAASCRFYGDDARRLHQLAALAQTARVPLLATNDVLYHTPARRRLQDVLTCIRDTCTIDEAGFRLARNAERHLKAPEEMARLFAAHP